MSLHFVLKETVGSQLLFSLLRKQYAVCSDILPQNRKRQRNNNPYSECWQSLLEALSLLILLNNKYISSKNQTFLEMKPQREQQTFPFVNQKYISTYYAHCFLRCVRSHVHAQAHTQVGLRVQYIACIKS